MQGSLDQFRLTEHLDFCPEQGQIRFGGSRVMLMNEGAMSALRETLSAQVGELMSRMILAQFGYQNAVNDYQELCLLFPDLNDSERLVLGPLMHAWSGIVSVEPEFMHVDRRLGRFHFKGLWHNSYEAQSHLKRYGTSQTPVCYSLTGYGSGWCSAYFGQRLLEIETKCVACGDPYCEWEIKPWDEWGPEAEPWKQALASTSRSIHRDLEYAITELQTVNESFEVRLEARAQAQREQLRMICHDVEGPLRMAIAALRESQAAGLDSGVILALKQLLRVDQMVSRARGASRFMDGKIAVCKERLNLWGEIRALVQDVSSQLLHKQIRIVMDVDQAMEGFGDRGVFRDQVLSNVLSNAIKFSPRGGTISINGMRDAAGYVGLEIGDQGLGIPSDMLKDIFSPRSRTCRVGTDGEVGSGYGLSLVKAGLDAMGGSVHIVSTTMAEDPLNHGTRVSVWISS
jgi:signal transduction histidine kinase